MTNNEMIILLCEGPSEYAYIQELNRYLRENEYNFKFIPKPIGTGFYSEVQKKRKEVRKDNPRTPIKIILDDDIYVRNEGSREQDNSTKFAESGFKDEFMFNAHNFEDFLMLHYDDETLNQWLAKCTETNHENIPMHSEQYMPLIKGMFPNYEKGELLFSPINQEKLDNLFRHNEDNSIFIKSDFATYLKNRLT